MIVTVEYPDGTVRLKTWRGSSARAIRKAALAKYVSAALQFGTPLYQNHYGAH